LIRKEFAGFAVVALDCLLLETLYGFQEGRSSPGKEAYEKILMEPPFSLAEDQVMGIYKNIRNGIIHDTETRKGWRIRMDTEALVTRNKDEGGFILNRTMFHKALNEAFEAWVKKLRGGDVAPRESMRCRMDEIIKKHCEL
jgi:hypothetical protein